MKINTFYNKDNNAGTIMKIMNYKKLNPQWGNGSKALRGCIVQTPDRSYKDNTLLFTRTKRTSNMLCMSNQILRKAHSHRM